MALWAGAEEGHWVGPWLPSSLCLQDAQQRPLGGCYRRGVSERERKRIIQELDSAKCHGLDGNGGREPERRDISDIIPNILTALFAVTHQTYSSELNRLFTMHFKGRKRQADKE